MISLLDQGVHMNPAPRSEPEVLKDLTVFKFSASLRRIDGRVAIVNPQFGDSTPYGLLAFSRYECHRFARIL